MSVVHVNSENWQSEVLDFGGTVLLDFYAQWCGPCRMVAPVLEEIAGERADVKVCKIDVDQAMDLAMEFHVASIPTLVVMKGGKVTAKTVSACDKREILELLAK